MLIEFSKLKIEKRGPIAKDVILDEQAFRPTLAKSLLDEITLAKNHESKFTSTSDPSLRVLISAASHNHSSYIAYPGLPLHWKCAAVLRKGKLRK